MMVIISYDVSTETAEGKRRLRKFEANLDYSAFLKLKEELLKIMDKDADSMRFYYLGNHWKQKIEHIGVKKGYDPEGTIII